jgi:hypothetical protein
MDDYIFTGEDELIDGKNKKETLRKLDFNKIIEIKAKRGISYKISWMMQIRKKSNRLVQPKTMPLQFGI